jgi:hypothetical protein
VAALRLNLVMRVLDTRIYPAGRHAAVWAPRRVDPRNKSGDDSRQEGGESALDDNGVPTSIDVKGPGVYISDFSEVTAIVLLEGTADGRADKTAAS